MLVHIFIKFQIHHEPLDALNKKKIQELFVQQSSDHREETKSLGHSVYKYTIYFAVRLQ